MTSTVNPQAATPSAPQTETLDRAQRWGLLGISIAAYLVGHFASAAVNVFADAGFGASLLADPGSTIAMTKAAAIAILVGIAATFVGKFIRPDAGLFAAAIALIAVRRSGGLSRHVYFNHPEKSTFYLLIIELILLAVVLGIVFVVSRRSVAMDLIPDDADHDNARPEREPIGQRLLATATTALVLTVGIALTCRSDAFMQITMWVFICSLLAAWCTVRFIPATPSLFFWLGPIVAGIVGYLLTSLVANPDLSIGIPGGKFANLALPMPLDYASAGVAGAVYGYWMGRKNLPVDESIRPHQSDHLRRH